MQRRTRNHICLWLIFLGLLNLLAYTIVYAAVGGDATNGGKDVITDDGQSAYEVYYIAGHFIRGPGGGQRTDVSRTVWIYSYLHSISLWPTQGMILIALLILARPHIIATMRQSTWIQGQTFITVVITLTAVVCSAMTIWFTIHFLGDLAA